MSVQLEVQFSVGRNPHPLLHEIARQCRVALTILWGRITADRASFRVELSGKSQQVEDLIRQFGKRGGTVRALASGKG